MNLDALLSYGNRQDRFSAKKTEQDFDEKLLAFRKEIRQQKLVGTDKTEEEKPAAVRQDSVRIFNSGDPQLFNAWDNTVSADEALETLDGNLSRIGEFSLDSTVKPEEAIEHFASQYSVYKLHFKRTGDTEALKRLDQLMETHVEKYAKSFGEVIGGFYEKNGVKNERQWMYESVKERISLFSESYDYFLSRNPNVRSLLDTAAQDGKSAAFSLRTAYEQYDGGELFYINKTHGGYSREELSEAVKLVKTAEAMAKEGTARATNEEELGVRLGKLALNALAYLETSRAKDIHKQGFMNAIDTHIDQLIEESDGLMSGIREDRQDEKSYPALDKEAVRFVIDSMVSSFKETKSYDQAVRHGEEQGLLVYLAKREQLADVKRYQDSSFWEDVAREMLERRLSFEQLA